MIKTVLLFTISILPIFLSGYLLVNLLLKNSHFLEKVFLGFLITSGLITFLWFALNLAGIPYTIGSFLALAWSCVIVLFVLNMALRRLDPVKPNIKNTLLKIRSLPIWVKILLFCLLIILASVLMADLYWPVKDWDSLVLYDYRAKVFLNTGFMTDGVARGYFFNYPLLTSLIHTWVYLTGVNNPMFYYFLVYLSFLVVFYYSLRRFNSRELSLIGTFFLAVTPEIFQHSLMSYTNLIYTVYLVLAYIYLYIWYNNQKNGILLISSLLLTLSTWARSSEPFWLIPILTLAIISVLRKKLVPIFAYIITFFPIQITWSTFQSRMQGAQYSTGQMMESSLVTLLTKFSFARILEIAEYLYKNVFTTWGILGIAFILFFIYAIVKLKKSKVLMFSFLILLSFCALFVGTYIFSFSVETWKEIPDSARRMSMFFLPMFIYSIFLILGKSGALLKSNNEQ